MVMSAVTIVIACQNGQIVEPELSGAVVTVVDSGVALKSARTFALPDTIVQLPQTVVEIRHDSDDEITSKVRDHLVAMGWIDITAVAAPANRPDVVVLVGASTRIQTTWAYSDWFGAWGYLPYWGGAVDASWGWGAPAGIPYSFPAGTLFISMLDLRGERPDSKRIPLLWAAAIDGVITSAGSTTQRALLGIDQAFAQSDYLRIP